MSHNKYLRLIVPADGQGEPIRVDVYAVLVAFGVACPARQHAIKKLLCAGLRGKGDVRQDLTEAGEAVRRAVELAEATDAPHRPGRSRPGRLRTVADT